MSTPTNFNQPSTPNPYGAPDSGNKDSQKRMVTIMGVAIGVLLLTSIYLLVNKYQTGRKLDATQLELTDQKAAFADLDSKYNEAVTQLEQQKGINAELDAKINEQLAQLEQNKSQIETMIREKRDYKAAMASFEKKKQEYLAEINQLKQQVGILTEEKTQLTADKESLTSSLNETRSTLDETQSAKAALISEKTQLESERNVLGKKVDIASAVKVSNIQVKSVSVTSSGKEKEKARAKKVDKLNICFTAEANEVVEAGQETFYIIVTDPTGVPLYLETLGSGVVTDKKKGEDFRYTTTATTNYSNDATQACGVWQPGQNFVKGKYKVDVYNKGYKVGTGAFQLK
jgi:hypothetical protein